MPSFNNKEEYEKWKTEKVEQTKRTIEIVQAKKEEKRLQKERLFVCRYCNKEVRKTFFNCMKCPYCQKDNPVPPLTKKDKNGCLLTIVFLILAFILLISTCNNEQTTYQEQKERELRKTLDTIGMDKEKVDDIIDTMKKNAGKR